MKIMVDITLSKANFFFTSDGLVFLVDCLLTVGFHFPIVYKSFVKVDIKSVLARHGGSFL